MMEHRYYGKKWAQLHIAIVASVVLFTGCSIDDEEQSEGDLAPEQLETDELTAKQLQMEGPTREQQGMEGPTPEQQGMEGPTPEEWTAEKLGLEEQVSEAMGPEDVNTEAFVASFIRKCGRSCPDGYYPVRFFCHRNCGFTCILGRNAVECKKLEECGDLGECQSLP